MEYTTLAPEAREVKEGVQNTPASLYEVCQRVVDGRAARGKRYELAALLVLLVLAKLAGMESLLGASEWIADQQERLCERLHLSWDRMPCANTYKYALARLDSQQVNAHLSAWFVRCEAQSRCGEEPSRLVGQDNQRRVHLAIDGKALRGTGKQAFRHSAVLPSAFCNSFAIIGPWKSSPLASRCDARRGSLWRSLAIRCSDARCSQHGSTLVDGFASGL